MNAGLEESFRQTREIVAANTLNNVRDLLLPGLRNIAGQYRLIPQQWEHVFYGTPRVDSETAARAKERARGLLKSLLTPEQWYEFETCGEITEWVGDGKFILASGGAMIRAVKERRFGRPVVERWCVYPDRYADNNDFMPDEDLLIGQLCHLRAGPDRLRAMANVFDG